ncbi:Fibronectin type III domain protein [Arcobacter nitrofigilis DSM 7299]|uniref:Fibronectin type III domain protein n=1 Tax=Arcobacter nitrofigilis (strain ATCC 33309 / DSM 7299 / CCUG 15893 / LMG 7604 / NCTC 12251 / CI) TaxID=572480 RepID=D5V5C6_ARCNC|nr:fibronectin type III domain-containing protein [Arcobacter nitrofigilis]ADG93061.1 Fibronectin type III domain protein [Arcobacter nitrofigilis DSM 7299]
MTKWIKISSTLLLILLISGCSTKNLGEGSKPKIDESLEVIDSNSIRTISGMTSIAFEWQKVDDSRVIGYNLYRANLNEESTKLKLVKFIKNRYTSHYLDTDLKPNTKYAYTFSSGTTNDVESRPTKMFQVMTLPRPEPIAFIQAISNLPRQIKIIWRPHENEAIEYYKIFRSTPQDPDWEKLETLNGRLQAEYIDTDLKDNVVYLYKVVAYTYQDIPSEDSQIVKAQTKALPAGVQNLTATNNQPKKITLNWQPSSSVDVVRYKIYRNTSPDGSFSELKQLNTDTTSYEDFINEDGKRYFYKITTVDKDGLESSKEVNPVMGITLTKLNKPILTLAQIQGEKAILNWQPGDNRAVSYNVYKTIKDGFFKVRKQKYTNITDLRFEDKDIVRGVEYNYSIEAVDENGIVSDRTAETLLVLPKLLDK